MPATPKTTRRSPLVGAALIAACYGGSSSQEHADDGDGSAADDGVDDAADDDGVQTGADDDGTGDDAVDDDGADDSAGTGVPGGPTFAEDVAPILAAHCWACHLPDGIAPFPMLEYEDVAPLGPAIVAATESRAMPPWPLDETGACNTFVDQRVLDDDELATLSAWVDAGTPSGDLSLVPEPPHPPALDDVSATIAIPAYTPQGSPPDNPLDDYRCFVIPSASATDTVLTGFEVHPGVESQVHHIVVFGLLSQQAEAAAIAMSGQDGRPGYTCFGAAGVSDTSVLVGWAPGVKVGTYPEGTGVPVSGGRAMVLQMHYNLASGAALDETAVDLRFDPSAIPLRSVVMFDSDISIPAGSTDHVEGQSTSFGGGDTTILAAFPHMHQIGTHLRVEVSDGSCALDVPRWDFHWQQLYSYAQPIVVPGGAQVTLTCAYDATNRTETTTFGEGSSDEMCGVQFLALP